MILHLRILLSCLSILFLLVVGNTQGIIRGNVFDKETGEAIIYGNVVLEGTTIGTNTDVDGFFSFTNLKPGDYIIQATYIGYDTIRTEIRIGKNIEYLRMYMEPNSIKLGVIDISAQREQARSEVEISKVRVTPKQIKSLPSVGGEADIAQYLQVIPGVVSTGDQGGQIYIRGGSPTQNKVLLDGMTIYNPFHSIGFFSIFDTEVIKNVDVLTGGFNSEYDGRISAIVDISTREGNRKRFGGKISLNPFLTKALFEGPIIPLKEESGGSTSFVLSAKRSILDITSQSIYPHATISDSVGLPYRFTDLYGKLSFINGNGSKLNIFGFNYEDEFNEPTIANFGWKNTGVGSNFTLLPGNSNAVLGGVIGFSNYTIQMQETNEPPRESSINGITAAFDFTFFGNNNEIKYGLVFNAFSTAFKFQNPYRIILQQNQNTTELGTFVNFRQVLGDLVLEPGVRIQFYASLGDVSIEPRIGLKYNITDYLRFKAAAGLYSQNLISTSTERDVVNLFTGFLSGPEETIYKLDSKTPASHNLQKATHAVAGFEMDLSNRFSLNAETYYKRFNQLIIVNRNKQSSQDPDFSTETGDAYGIDLSLKYETPQLSVFGGYSTGYVKRFDGEQEYFTVFDRRHNVNLLANYNFGYENRWSFSIRWNYGSGFPFTKTQGFYNFNPFLDGLDTDYLTDNPDKLGIIYSEERNGGRLPDYHRLDASITRTITFSKHSILELNASITNLYNRENIFYFDRVEYERVNQLPILPSIGLKLSF